MSLASCTPKNLVSIVAGAIVGTAILTLSCVLFRRKKHDKGAILMPKTREQWESIVKKHNNVITFVGTKEEFDQFLVGSETYLSDQTCASCNSLIKFVVSSSPVWVFVPALSGVNDDTGSRDIKLPALAFHINHSFVFSRSLSCNK